MTAQQSRPGVGIRAAQEAIHDAEPTLPDAARCCACRRLAALARQVARADMDELDRIGRDLDLVGGELL